MTRQSKPSVNIEWWRPILGGVLVGMAVVAVLAGVSARYLRDNVLETDAYLQIIQPLPKDPAIAEALATYTTNTLFDATSAEQTIKEFLPPRLSPLAPPLTDALQSRVHSTTKQFVQSDNFATIWAVANRATHERIINLAESSQRQDRLAQAASSLDLSRLSQAVRERFGAGDTVLTPAQKARAAQVRIDLRQRVERFRTNVRIVRGAADVLPYLSVALLLGAVAVAHSRRRTVMSIGVLLALLGASTIIAFKLVSGSLLGNIADPIYQTAAEAIYQAFYADLHRRISLVIGLGLLLFVGAVLASPYGWTTKLQSQLRIQPTKKTKVYSWAQITRTYAGRYEWVINSVAFGLAILVLVMLPDLRLSAVMLVVSLLGGFVAILHLIAGPAPVSRTTLI
jgi:hypothetical protein